MLCIVCHGIIDSSICICGIIVQVISCLPSISTMWACGPVLIKLLHLFSVNEGVGLRHFLLIELGIGLLGLAIDTGVNRLNHALLKWHRGLDS